MKMKDYVILHSKNRKPAASPHALSSVEIGKPEGGDYAIRTVFVRCARITNRLGNKDNLANKDNNEIKDCILGIYGDIECISPRESGG